MSTGRYIRIRQSIHFAIALLTFATAGAAAQDEREPPRHALVIGNSAYDPLPKLPSAANDAANVAARLRRLKFDVDTATIANADTFEREILPRFAAKINEGDVVVVYVSGHGFTYGDDNWIAPLGLPLIVPESWMPDSAVSLANIGDLIAARSPALILLISDACRGIQEFVIRDSLGNNAAGRGIAEDPEFGEDNGMIGYATKKGTFARGTEASNELSRFTKSLVANLETADRSFVRVFDRVAAEVSGPNNEQIPMLAKWSAADLFLKPTSITHQQEREEWESARDSGDWENVRLFSRMYATSAYATAARTWLKGHRPSAQAPRQTASSPAAIDRAWDPSAKAIVVIPNSIGLGYDRFVATARTKSVIALSDTELGSGRKAVAQTNSAKLSADVAAAVAHEAMVSLRDLVAHAQPATT